MRKLAIGLSILTLTSFGAFAQKKNESTFKPDKIELITPWIFNGERTTGANPAVRGRNCFDLIILDHGCGWAPLVAYGDRIGINWDLFHVAGGKVDRTRMVEIGKFDWTDKFTVPYVEPWPALLPGERRTININASGGNGAPGRRGQDGADGIAGMNGDGTYSRIPRPKQTETMPPPIPTSGKSYATAKVREQVSSTVKDSSGKVRSDAYSPMVEVKKGYMYVVRVVDESRDFYVIIHVDDLLRGDRVVLSYWKFEPLAL